MSNPDLAVVQYLELAKISQTKQQLAGRDRFLILAGIAACRAGWLDVAETCRRRVLEHNPRHLLSQWDTLPNALRSQDFATFLRQLERFCPVERAETLLTELGARVSLPEDVDPKDLVLEQLAEISEGPPVQFLTDEPDPGESGKTA
jgi:hypothetical protein